MPDLLKIFVALLIIPFLYSCQKPLQAQEQQLEKRVAYTQFAEIKYAKHTMRAKKQQRDICDRLQKIKERIEKRRKRKGKK